ncbi:hypothetical protein BLOT_007006 [Blomia tropicalis]|nr:hypothetical protein BLOT_007006 [Blomia tropicalis]
MDELISDIFSDVPSDFESDDESSDETIIEYSSQRQSQSATREDASSDSDDDDDDDDDESIDNCWNKHDSIPVIANFIGEPGIKRSINHSTISEIVKQFLANEWIQLVPDNDEMDVDQESTSVMRSQRAPRLDPAILYQYIELVDQLLLILDLIFGKSYHLCFQMRAKLALVYDGPFLLILDLNRSFVYQYFELVDQLLFILDLIFGKSYHLCFRMRAKLALVYDGPFLLILDLNRRRENRTNVMPFIMN